MSKVLITGGASGIGYAMAEAFAAIGDDVWITDVDPAALKDCPDHWNKSAVDVSDEDQMAMLFETVAQKWGAPDTVCANAGIAGPTAKVEDVTLADWNSCVAITLGGVFLTAKFAAPLMKHAGRGTIIVTSSTAGQYGYPNRAPYAAAKWGVIGLMKTLAMELGPSGIRVNAICPGSVEGPRMDGVLEREARAKGMTREDVYRGYASGTSMGSFVTASDIANMTVFLASDGARLVSGQVIAVDGHTENPDPKV
ncbi:SDR family oxidoreductase [Planktotalea sp.]|uniref:SDR family oxidoreductase n=1 Tax=Planktotalea sp. TaxID=2029877 RepID=UPI0025F2462D|nr:SDR family oxidoreductase [Planktotalea sp.]